MSDSKIYASMEEVRLIRKCIIWAVVPLAMASWVMWFMMMVALGSTVCLGAASIIASLLVTVAIIPLVTAAQWAQQILDHNC